MPSEVWLEVFTAGVGTSYGLCVVSCSPLILSYLAGFQSDDSVCKRKLFWLGVNYILIFSLGRLLTYILIGSFAGIFYIYFFSHISPMIYPFQGLFLIFLGSFILYNLFKSSRCKISHIKEPVKFNYLNFFILGLLLGGGACPTFFLFLPYLCLHSTNPLLGALLGGVFGLGTLTFFLPIFIVGGIIKSYIRLKLISGFAGIFLIFWGVRALLSYN